MKLFRSKTRPQRANVLIVALFMACVIGFFLFYYLNLVGQQRTMVARASGWNSSLAVAEAGVEEALAQLNPGVPVPVIDRAANGWRDPKAGGYYGPMIRTLSPNSTYSAIYTTDKYPIIYTTGYVTVPALKATLVRNLRVATTNIPLFNVAMAAKTNIDFKGNGASTDSFDSGNTNLSNNGVYISTKASTNGDVASVAGIVEVGNGNIHGDVYLSPTGTDGVSGNGLITGTVYHNFNASFGDVMVPQTNWLNAGASHNPRVVGTNSYQYVFTASDSMWWYATSLNGSLYVDTNTTIRLWLKGNSSPTLIRVAGPGTNSGNLVIYMDAPTFTLSGGSLVDGGAAVNLSYFGTTNNTTVNLSGNASFVGTIYAPSADFSLGGGGKDTYDFSGSIIARSITVNGHFNFHYDEALLRNGPLKGYTAISWREL